MPTGHPWPTDKERKAARKVTRHKNYEKNEKQRSEENRARAAAYQRKHPEEYKAAQRATRLYREFGLTVEEWEAMFEAQGGRCLGCNRHQSEFKKRFDVDHEHVEGYDEMPPEDKKKYVRGLLCWACNTSIGKLQDDPQILRTLADYIERNRRTSI